MMEYRALGKSGISGSAIALGTWAIGGWMWGGTDEAKAIGAIQAAIDAGVTLIDTAAVYGFGLSEEIVGKAIAGRRDEVVVATKCGLLWDKARGEFYFENAGKSIYRCLAPDSIRREVEQSLRRLRIECIDLYQTHWQDSTTPIADTMGALMDLKKEGKIRAVGACNANPRQLAEYQAAGELAVAQNKFSMLDREIESELAPFCMFHDLAILAYSPLALGLLTGKVGPDRKFGEGDQRAGKERFSRENRERTAKMLDRIRPAARAHDISLAQLVIAWTISRPGVTHALVGARNPDQARENAAAGGVVLADAENALIEEALAELGPI